MSDQLSRSAIISLLAGLPLAAALNTSAIAATAADDSGGTKKMYQYKIKPGPGGKKCSGCASFVAPAGCKIVKGKISPNGYCIAFAPKAT